MIEASDITLAFGARPLFENVSVKFTRGNCYGLIGANGAGKSSFLKILAGDLAATHGKVNMTPGERMSVLRQDHFAFDEHTVIHTVLMGHDRLYKIIHEKNELYAKTPFTDEDGLKVSELEADFAELGGWEAESNAGELLCGLGIPTEQHETPMGQLADNEKVRVLLAQALFGDPDILLLDEPTNHLDVQAILWLEDFLADFENTVIVVSHDRHFLNQVCTHIADIDYQKLRLYAGNYDFWYEASQLALRQRQDQNRKSEARAKELKAFIQRFSANAAKSRQATARKKLLDKLDIASIPPSSRKYPHVVFKPEERAGKDLLTVKDLQVAIPDGGRGDGDSGDSGEGGTGTGAKTAPMNFHVQRGERIAFVGPDSGLVSNVLAALACDGIPGADTGRLEEPGAKLGLAWSSTANVGYFPKDNARYFQNVELSLVDWLRQFSHDAEENFVRSFLGKMLFTREESLKPAKVLSGGEKVRCMLAKLMLQNPNVLVLDGPTNHLDLESITALNNGLKGYEGTLLIASHDVAFVESLATRVIEVTPQGATDHLCGYDVYLAEQREREGK